MVTPSYPTGSHYTHWSLQKLALPTGPTELASPKPNPKLTTNPLHTTKSATTNSASIIWQPRQQLTLRWVPKAKPHQRRKPHRKNRPNIFKSSRRWHFLRMQGYYTGISYIRLPKIILPNTQSKAKQEAMVRALDTDKS